MIGMILMFIYSIKVEPYLSIVKSHVLNGENYTEKVRVVQVSDVQISENFTAEHLKKIVKKINSLNPDIFIFTGDLYENYATYGNEEAVIRELSNIKARYGKFAIWGNRDYGGGLGKKYERILEESGIELLKNSGINIQIESGKTMFIGGLDDYLLGKPNITPIINGWLDSNSYRILLTHEPDTADFYTSHDFNLILAGHSHGGQVSLPFVKEVTTAMARKYTSGFYKLDSPYQTLLYVNPKLVDTANDLGYLIGTYDSYHSIHKPGEEQWITAQFTDTSLYEEATVTDKNGEKIQGFQGEGRKLNPVLAFDSVKERVSSILDTGIKFNSWFLDTDGTGEVFDDYSPDHITTEAEDIKARIQRLEYLQNEWHMVVGTEGGNDFINPYVAFAHGIETPSFSWMDEDMSKNKESEYYVGRYYSSYNGVPEMFSKQIPLKDKYKKLFLDTTYTIPLYKLVYNDSVITTHWWGWGTLKFEDEIEERMLYEVLYNVPPLYHLDKYEWEKQKEVIVKHSNIWSEFSKQVINKEMTDFKILSEDRLVQMTEYGNEIKVIANFSNQEVGVKGILIPEKSLIIVNGQKQILYTP